MNKTDKKYFREAGDPDFNPDRNKQVIENAIKKHEENRRQKQKMFEEELDERVDASASYLRRLEYSHIPAEKYFGKKELGRLQGKKILERIIKLKNKQYLQLDSI